MIWLAVPYRYSSWILEISLATHRVLLGESSSINFNVSITLNGDSYNIIVEVDDSTLLNSCFFFSFLFFKNP